MARDRPRRARRDARARPSRVAPRGCLPRARTRRASPWPRCKPRTGPEPGPVLSRSGGGVSPNANERPAGAGSRSQPAVRDERVKPGRLGQGGVPASLHIAPPPHGAMGHATSAGGGTGGGGVPDGPCTLDAKRRLFPGCCHVVNASSAVRAPLAEPERGHEGGVFAGSSAGSAVVPAPLGPVVSTPPDEKDVARGRDRRFESCRRRTSDLHRMPRALSCGCAGARRRGGLWARPVSRTSSRLVAAGDG